jgi:hypothetical protein
MTSMDSFREFSYLNADLIRTFYFGRCPLTEVYLVYTEFLSVGFALVLSWFFNYSDILLITIYKNHLNAGVETTHGAFSISYTSETVGSQAEILVIHRPLKQNAYSPLQ